MQCQNKSLMESVKKLISDKEILEKKEKEFVSALEAKVRFAVVNVNRGSNHCFVLVIFSLCYLVSPNYEEKTHEKMGKAPK